MQALTSPGVNYEWSSDGHEKLEWKGLRMGIVSIPIHVIREKFTGYIISLRVVPDARDQSQVAHLFLDAFEAEGGQFPSSLHPNFELTFDSPSSFSSSSGVPIQQTTDMGTETREALSMHATLRYVYPFSFRKTSPSKAHSVSSYLRRSIFGPQYDPAIYAYYKRLRSVHNTTSEAVWSFWLRSHGTELKEWLRDGVLDDTFDTMDDFDA